MMKKRIASMFVAVLMAISFTSTSTLAIAADNQEKAETNAEELNVLIKDAEVYVANWQMSTASMRDKNITSQVTLGNTIPVYEYTSSGVSQLEMQYYPIFEDNTICGFVISYENSAGNFSTQFTTSLSAELANIISTQQPIALLYDQFSIYASCQGQLIKLQDYNDDPEYFTDRAVISNQIVDSGQYRYEDIDGITEIIPSVLQELEVDNRYSSTYASKSDVEQDSLDVDFYTQKFADNSRNPTQICWACSCACVGNYLTGSTDWDGFTLAWDYCKSYYKPQHVIACRNILEDYYGVSLYGWAQAEPTFTQIMNHITKDYPMIVRVTDNSNPLGWGHIIVAYGWWADSQSRYVMYMDPGEGFTMGSVDYNGNFSYLSGATACWVSHTVHVPSYNL